MSLHSSKRTALLYLVNCLPSGIGTIETFNELSDGKLFCDIIKIKIPEIQDILPAEERQNVYCEEKSKDDQLCDSVNSELEDVKMICEDSKTESEDVIKKDSETVQESDIELVKFAVSDSECTITPTKSTDECVIEPTKSVFRNPESITKQVKSSLSNSESLTKPPKSLDGDSKSAMEPVRSSDNDAISKRYKIVQNFIDAIYKLRSELVISYPECRNANELELAKVTIFILSDIVQHYVLQHNPVIQTLSHVDIKIQQDLEQCFSFFINNRNKIYKDNVHKLLCGHAPYKISSSPNRSYCNTPRRSCPSRYRSNSPASSSSQENVYTDSPLQKFFDSPNFTKADIIAKDKELMKLRKILFEEEDRHYDLLQELKTDVETKEKEISNLKKKVDRLKAEKEMLEKKEKKPKDCKDCKKKDEIIEKQKYIQCIGEKRQENEGKCLECVESEKKLGALYKSYSLVKMQAVHAMETADRADEIADKKSVQVFNLELEVRELKEQLEKCTEKLLDARNKRLESPEHDDADILGSYSDENEENEENEKLHKEILHLKERLEEVKDSEVKHVMVQCPEQCIDYSGRNESNVSVPGLLPLVDLPENEKFQNSDKSASKECNLSDVSNKLDAISRYVAGSPSTDVSLSKTMNTTLSIDGTGVSSKQCNGSTSDYEIADKVLLSDSSSPAEFLNKVDRLLTQIIDHPPAFGLNGSNNGFFNKSHVMNLREYLKSVKINYCISQTAESQNNNSISKDIIMTNETGSCGSQRCQVCPNKKARIDDPNRNITTTNEECSDVFRKNQTDDLENELKKQIESFEKKLEKEQEETDNLKKGLEENQKEIDNLKKGLDKKQEEIDSSKKELENKQEKIKNLKKDINDLKKRLEKKQEEIDSLKKGLKEKQEEIKKLKKEREDIDSLKKRLEKKQEEIDSLKKEIENKQEEIKNLKKEQEDINSLKKVLEEKQEEIDSLIKGFEEKQEEIDSVKKGLDEEKEKVDNLKKELEEVSENLKLKEEGQIFWQEKYSYAKRSCKERLMVVEHKLRRLEMEFKDMKQRKNSIITRKNSENSSLIMDLNAMCKSQARTAAELSVCISKLRKMEDENKQLHETIQNFEEAKKEAAKGKKEVEEKLKRANALLKVLSSKITPENSLFPAIKGIKDEYPHLENTNDGVSKSKHISPSSNEVTALDTGNASTSSRALSTTIKGGLISDDEASFQNHSSLAEIISDYESTDGARRQELKRRNTMCPNHLQSSYPAEAIQLTPVAKKLSKSNKYKISEYPLDNNGHIRKKRKVSESKAEDQSSTPAAKIKRTFKTPSSLHKLLQFKRIQRPGSIKPKP